jgi:acyl-CoA dehydrogenase
MSERRYLAALIPEEYGGLGMDLAQAPVILEEINRSGATPSPPTRRCTRWGPC